MHNPRHIQFRHAQRQLIRRLGKLGIERRVRQRRLFNSDQALEQR
jgi:hypothetical protein